MAKLTVPPGVLILLLALMLIGGCAATRIERPVPLVSAAPDSAPAEHRLLDIAINLFAPVAAPEPPPALASASAPPSDGLQNLRTAEGYYLSWQFAQTLQRSGHWGAVRLNPFTLEDADLSITGTLLQSDGETLRIRIEARDATGRAWLDQEYLQVVDGAAYASTPGATPQFPFQPLLNRIGNDLLAFRERRLSTTALEDIRKISALRFAADFAPGIYRPYLSSARGGRVALERLPPLEDPVFAQIATIRARNALFLDAVQAQYGVFVAQVDEPYRKFLARSQVITGILNTRFQTEADAAQYGATSLLNGGMEGRSKVASRYANPDARSDALNTGSNARIYAAALAEAGATLEMVVQPQTLRFSAHSVDLSGSLAEQFAQWRSILGEIHALDTAP